MNEVEKILIEGKELEQALANDKRYAPEYKQKKIAEVKANYEQRAINMASAMLSSASKEAEAALLGEQDAEAAFVASLNYAALSTSQKEAEMLAGSARTWQEIEQAIAKAKRSPEALRAWASVGLPVLEKRVHALGDPLTLQPGEGARIERVARQIAELQSEVEPEPLKVARARRLSADQNLFDVRNSLSSTNRYAGGGRFGHGVLDEVLNPRQAPTVTKTEKGWIIESVGGWF